MLQKSLVVIGGGAAGFFCAINAAIANPKLKITLLEKSSKLLSKVKISGGGRCNVTHQCLDIIAMSKHYPRGEKFLKKAFSQFSVKDTIQWFESRGVHLKTEPDGRMFPVSNSSQSIVDCLLSEAAKYKIDIKLNIAVQSITKTENHFTLSTNTANNNILKADYVCVACGGFPKAEMFDWLKQLGHSVENPVPSLFTFNMPKHKITQLMGVSIKDVQIKITGTKLVQTGALLITHWGLSGPVVLRLSAWGARILAEKNWNFSILINYLPEYNEETMQQKLSELQQSIASRQISNKNFFGLPSRFWEYLISEAEIQSETRWADLTAKCKNKLAKLLCAHLLDIKGKTTFKEEFVTAGGVNLSEIDAQTMMSKKQHNLFFAGEILDVDGITGGFNFQNAWTTAWIAAQSMGSLSS